MSRYNPNDDYCEAASNFQSVKSEDDVRKLNPSLSEEEVNKERTDNLYPCSDKYKMGTIQDDQIYIATTDAQHDQIYNHQHVDANGGLSGFFSDQATIDSCKDNQNAVSNKAYNEACQMAAYQPTSKGDATYKPHIDCFEIDREALYRNYGTYDFNAAIAKCEANNQFGSGGGNQGYNPYISEMIDNGTLKYNPDKSYSDSSISNSKHCNPNQLYNSVVPEEKAEKMYDDARNRAQDCVKNNTPHPSSEACKNGYKHNPNPIQTPTGNATEWKKGENSGMPTKGTKETGSKESAGNKKGESSGMPTKGSKEAAPKESAGNKKGEGSGMPTKGSKETALKESAGNKKGEGSGMPTKGTKETGSKESAGNKKGENSGMPAKASKGAGSKESSENKEGKSSGMPAKAAGQNSGSSNSKPQTSSSDHSQDYGMGR